MQFRNASVVEEEAEIDPTGWPAINNKVELDLIVTKKIDQLRRNDVVHAMRTGADRKLPHNAHSKKGSWSELSTMEYFPAVQDASWVDYKQKLINPKARVSQLTYIVNGCVRTGANIRIKGSEYDLCKSIGSYAYVVRHAGRNNARWTASISGHNVKDKKAGSVERYQVSLDKDKKVKLKNRFEADEKPLKPKKPIKGKTVKADKPTEKR